MKTLTRAEAEAFLKNGGKLVRRFRNMPEVFETAAGLVSRRTVKELSIEGRVEEKPTRFVRGVSVGAEYTWKN